MPHVVVDDRGCVEETGNGVDFDVHVTFSSHFGIIPQTILSTGSDWSNSTILTHGGLYHLSASGPRNLMVHLPKPEAVPGEMFIFRNLGTGSHVITASRGNTNDEPENRIVPLYSGNFSAKPCIAQGSSLKFPVHATPTTGSSIVLLCDGQSYLVLGQSGSFSLTAYTTPQNPW